MEEKQSIDYHNKLILAPMVRVGMLPARLQALDYGADLVYSEEIIDFKILSCKREENAILKTVDFVTRDGTVVFRTCAREKGKVILQIGTSNGKRALQAAKKVETDVAGIDVNMGCPKSFSIQGGMGAALLTQPDQVKEILTTLVQGLSIPVTCKIRILPSLEETLELVRLIEGTGVKAIAVHGRTKQERPRHKNHDDYLREIVKAVDIPVIANGGSKEIATYEDIAKFKEQTWCSSVMLARSAQWNYSIFRKEGKLPLTDVIKEYIKYSVQYESPHQVVKYCILHSLQDDICNSPEGEATQQVYNMEDICAVWGLSQFHKDATEKLKTLRAELLKEDIIDVGIKRRKSDDGKIIIEMPVKYTRKYYSQGLSPKLILHEYTKKNSLPRPVYQTVEGADDRLFHCVLTVDNIKYCSPTWEKSKQSTEQAAAIVFLKYHNLEDPVRKTPAAKLAERKRNGITISLDSTNSHVDEEDETGMELLLENIDKHRDDSKILSGVQTFREHGSVSVGQTDDNCKQSASNTVNLKDTNDGELEGEKMIGQSSSLVKR